MIVRAFMIELPDLTNCEISCTKSMESCSLWSTGLLISQESLQIVKFHVQSPWRVCSLVRSRIHRLYLLYQHSPIYSCWFCCGPYPCGVCWGISTASTQIYGQVLICSLVGIGSFAIGVALQIVVPPIMLALLFEEVVKWLDFMKEALPWFQAAWGWLVVMTGMASVISLPPAFSPAGYRSANARWGDTSQYRLSTFVGRRHPVMHLQLSLREASTFFAWDDLSHTGQASIIAFYSQSIHCCLGKLLL